MSNVAVGSEIHVIDPDHQDIPGRVTQILPDAQIDVELDGGGPQKGVPHVSKAIMSNPASSKGTMRWYLNSSDPKVEGASTTLEDPPTIEVQESEPVPAPGPADLAPPTEDSEKKEGE